MQNVQKSKTDEKAAGKPVRVGLFVTCLVDLFRPSVGFASIKLLQAAGCQVCVPKAQTCCGQPAYNSGDRANARAIAMQVIEAFENYDAVVAPSGSCAAMLKKHYPGLFDSGSSWRGRAERLGHKTHELTSFLTDVLGQAAVSARCEAVAVYHDSCSGLRELGVREQPRALLKSVKGLRLAELKEGEVCCGFGGTFCVKYPDISNSMVKNKADNVHAAGADLLLAGDLGCLLNIAGKLSRDGCPIKVRHVVEVLADMSDNPAIGEAESQNKTEEAGR